MRELTLPRVLRPTSPVVADTVAVFVDGDTLANALIAVEDAESPALTGATEEPFEASTPEARRCVQAFAIVSTVVGLLTRSDVCGPTKRWRGGNPLVVRCVEPALPDNARYLPASHRLELGVGAFAGGEPVFAADDADVVAHETGHALLHELAPDLLAGWHPESLAIHEAVADLVAVLALLDSGTFREVVVGSLAAVGDNEALPAIAEGFARALGKAELRSIRNDATLPGAGPPEGQVASVEPHALSLVLSGTIWSFVVEGLTRYIAKETAFEKLSALERQLRRLILRALVYTPPGELTFGDIGRLLVGADRATHGEHHGGQEVRLDALFRARGILVDEGPLPEAEPVLPPLPSGGPDDAWLAAVEAVFGRGPCDRDRVQVSSYTHRVNPLGGAGRLQTETLVRLSWTTSMALDATPRRFRVVRGATIVVEPETGAVRVRILTGGWRPLDEERRSAFLAWRAQRGRHATESTPLGLVPVGLEGELHVRDSPG